MKTIIICILIMLTGVAQAGNLKANVYFEHTSNPTINESGYGFNAVFTEVEYRNKNMFISVGIGMHSESLDCPEVCFGGRNLFRAKAGWSFDIN